MSVNDSAPLLIITSDVAVVGMLSGGFLLGASGNLSQLVPLGNGSVLQKPPNVTGFGDVYMLPEPSEKGQGWSPKQTREAATYTTHLRPVPSHPASISLDHPVAGNNSYRVVVSAQNGDDVPLLLNFESTDLLHWSYTSVLFQGDSSCGPRAECPNYFELNGQMVLFISCPTEGELI